MTAAMSQGSRSAGTVTWTPLAGRMAWGSVPSSRARTASAQTPEALTTMRARMGNSDASSSGTGRTTAPLAVPSAPVGEADDGGVVGHDRAVLEGGGAGHGERQAGVVGPGVEVEEPRHQMVGVQRGEVGERLVLGDLPVAFADAPAAGEVVHPQRGGIRAGHRLGDDAVAAEEGDEERQRADQVRRVVEQALALGQVLVDEAELALLEVADAAVDHLRGLRGRPRGEVALLDQGGPQAAAGGVEGHPGAGDAAADDQHVELLVGEAAQRVGAAKGVHRSSLPHPSRAPTGPPQLPSG